MTLQFQGNFVFISYLAVSKTMKKHLLLSL